MDPSGERVHYIYTQCRQRWDLAHSKFDDIKPKLILAMDSAKRTYHRNMKASETATAVAALRDIEQQPTVVV